MTPEQALRSSATSKGDRHAEHDAPQVRQLGVAIFGRPEGLPPSLAVMADQDRLSVVILGRPEGRPPCGRHDQAAALGVAIPGRPEGRSPFDGNAHCYSLEIELRSSATSRGDRHVVAQDLRPQLDRVVILDRPKDDRHAATVEVAVRAVAVAILSRPEERPPFVPWAYATARQYKLRPSAALKGNRHAGLPDFCDDAQWLRSSAAPKDGRHRPAGWHLRYS
ncbi:hypothetical protein ACFV14_38260 [Streptomyces zaomyceticus]|uniref:hypothetical protein n=1 Tax=Streptomyces zaomyceticus TaxID=68286 RepID=UPI00369FC2B9